MAYLSYCSLQPPEEGAETYEDFRPKDKDTLDGARDVLGHCVTDIHKCCQRPQGHYLWLTGVLSMPIRYATNDFRGHGQYLHVVLLKALGRWYVALEAWTV